MTKKRRRNISVPIELDDLMRLFGDVNWSFVACEAFRQEMERQKAANSDQVSSKANDVPDCRP